MKRETYARKVRSRLDESSRIIGFRQTNVRLRNRIVSEQRTTRFHVKGDFGNEIFQEI